MQENVEILLQNTQRYNKIRSFNATVDRHANIQLKGGVAGFEVKLAKKDVLLGQG